MLLKNNFNGGSNGTTISTANSGGTSGDAFQTVTSAPAYTTTNATGTHAPLVAQLVNVDELYWTGLTFTGRTLWARAYIYLTAYPTAPAGSILTIGTSGSTGGGRLRINNTGTLFVANPSFSTLTGMTTSAPVPLNQWVRVELMVTVGTTTSNGVAELRVYHSADSSTPTQTLSGSNFNLGTVLPTQVLFTGPAASAMYLDDIATTDVNWLGPNQLNVSFAPERVESTWSLPAPSISTGSTVALSTVSSTWSLPDPEVVTADGLTPVNPDRVESAWSLPEPDVQAFRNVTVTPETVTSTWQVLDPLAGVPVNPGDQIAAPGQIEWNGFVLGSGTPYRMQRLDGWITDMPTLDSTNVAQPNRHGSYSGRKYSQERTVTLSGLIRTRREDMEQVVQALIRETPVLQDDTELPLAIRLHEVVYVGYGSVIRRSIPVDKNYRIGQAQLTMQWVLSDPLLLSRELNSAVIADGASQILTNLGNAETYPTIRIPGPVVNPAIEIENSGIERLLEFNLTVPSGQTLIIDPYYGTVTLAGAVVNATESSTAVTDMVLPAGQNTVTYDGGGSGPEITVLWRHAYL